MRPPILAKYNSNNISNVKCPICSKKIKSSEKKLKLFHQASWGKYLFVCNDCDFSFLHPRPTEKMLSEFYERNYPKIKQNKKRLNILEKTALKRFEKYNKFIKLNCSIYDHGCGSGLIGKKFIENRNDIYYKYWDFDTTIIDELLSKSERAEKINPLSKEENKFGCLISFHVLEHVNDPIKYLSKLRKKLKKDSTIIIEVPKLFGRKVSINDLMVEHLNYFSPKALQKVLINSFPSHKFVSIDNNLEGVHDTFCIVMLNKDNKEFKTLKNIKYNCDAKTQINFLSEIIQTNTNLKYFLKYLLKSILFKLNVI